MVILLDVIEANSIWMVNLIIIVFIICNLIPKTKSRIRNMNVLFAYGHDYFLSCNVTNPHSQFSLSLYIAIKVTHILNPKIT
jgi:hypothetical protein